MSQKFLRAETYARVKGRPDKRHAMAVVIGTNGRPAPMLEELDVADSDRAAVNALIDRAAEVLDASETSRPNIILAPLPHLIQRYLPTPHHSQTVIAVCWGRLSWYSSI